jgi:hypothetical protein
LWARPPGLVDRRRRLALAGAVVAVGSFAGSRTATLTVVAIGVIVLAVVGALLAGDYRGAAREFGERAYTDQGLHVKRPDVVGRIVGVGMIVIGAVGAAAALSQLLR